MREIWDCADELGPAKTVFLHDPRTQLRAVVVVDNVACGPSIGGCRMAPDVTWEECRRLARAMTLKNAAAGLPHGGGKSVIAADPGMPPEHKERLVRSFARAIGELEDYIVGPDMGTDETAMAWCRDEIGRAVGLPRELGGIPLDEIGATGFGLSIAAEVAQTQRGDSLEGAAVVIEGFGAVGRHAARCLEAKGARIVAVADSRGLVSNPAGLDVNSLLDHKAAGRPVREYEGGEPGELEALLDVPCDLLVPAARPDVIRADNAARVRASLVVPGANIAVTDRADELLYARGVMVVPDFIVNAGGVICAASEHQGATERAALASIQEKVAANTLQVLENARESGVSPRLAALELARRRVESAMRFRR